MAWAVGRIGGRDKLDLDVVGRRGDRCRFILGGYREQIRLSDQPASDIDGGDPAVDHAIAGRGDAGRRQSSGPERDGNRNRTVAIPVV